MRHRTEQVVGWIGVVLVLSAYFLVSFGAISAQSSIYPVLNLIGSGAIIYEALSKKDYQPVTLNIIWGLIALISLARLLFR